MEEFPQLELVNKRSGPGTKEDLLKYANHYLTMSKHDLGGMVFDRFTIPSEYVYGVAIRNMINLDPADCYLLETRLLSKKPLVIYCTRPIERILSSFDERDQMEGVKENIEKVHMLYEAVMDRLGFEWMIEYDYEREGDYEEVVSIVRDYLTMEVNHD